ncbi:uncharacterized protein N7496_000036 [Penicillium cataractarum]|uniref:LipA and NB-ARC domain protein n=1 Tax=Penicillium cataractarum TaxID=2100454 RepID=A0A9X0B5J9_9EURO|nr:uncharacterized protein N7496_000036 [Penicillium cataractarum]KAJ5388968.1 hypothetical protein N7496_000036 [Penicillium cataractarum]
MASTYLRPVPPPDGFQIRRKPVSNPNLRGTALAQAPGGLSHATTSPCLAPPPLSRPPSYNDLYGATLPVPQPDTCLRPRTAGAFSSSAPPSPSPSPSRSPSPTPVQKAYGEARHFLGGLINHPTESNKHFTILRHSHGLVFYRGNATSVAVSIFSDTPLPQDRTVWLQNKGWSGKTGMRAKALFRLNDSWLDVTPGMPVRADQVNPDDERAWQRDIKKFFKKAPSRQRDAHRLRETVVVRIPAEAGDGYFQLVLCQGQKKKVLGNSPVFRVISTSTNPHSIRGASLSTLPLEVGAMVVSLYAQTAAQTVMTPATTAVTSVTSVTSKLNPYRPSWLTQAAAQKAYSASGIQDRVAGIYSGSSAQPRKVQGDGCPAVMAHEVSPAEIGPQPPFPMIFQARGQLGHSISPSSPSDTPKLTLAKFPDWVPEQLRGYFFGWARFDISTGKEKVMSPWCPSILSIRTLDPLQAERVNMSQVAKHVVQLRLLDEVPFQITKVEIRVMGFLRVDIPPPTGTTSQELADAQAAAAEAAVLADAYDISVVQSTLSHPAWAADGPTVDVSDQQNTGWVDKTRQGVESIRAKGQKWVEQVPLHRLGVRSVADEWRERQVAVNGFYIVR